ncbi:MAG: tyrosine--tRNA ligase [Sphingomicrobium sp.]
MTSYKSSLLRLLDERGYIHQLTDAAALDALAQKETVTAYIGFDATAPSLHVGSLVQIMMLRRLQQAGHRPLVLMGGGTTKVGDPSGKDESRKLLTDADIAANIASIRKVFERFLDFGDGPNDAILLDNAEWLDALDYVPFLREVGRHFTINRMLTFDSVKLRLDREQPLTFLEFNYMILQAYDFLELSRRAGCRVQMGGSDQWGNIVNGIELTRRVDGTEVFGVTTPLITTADGGKMGKTARGAIWLNADQLSPYDYWQFWRNTADADVGRFLRLFTDLPLDRINELERVAGAAINRSKVVLSTEATAMLHGRDAAEAAERTAAETFAGGGAGEDLPRFEVDREDVSILAALTGLSLCFSNKEAKRKIAEGAVRLDGNSIFDPGLIIQSEEPIYRISVGKKNHGIISFEDFMSNQINAIYENHRDHLLTAFIDHPDRFSSAYAYALFYRIAPIFHESSSREVHDGDPFEKAYWVSSSFITNLLKHIDDLWLNKDFDGLEFYKLEENFGGYKTNRSELIHALEYIRISDRFDDEVWRSISTNAPVEAHEIRQKFLPSDVYFG